MLYLVLVDLLYKVCWVYNNRADPEAHWGLHPTFKNPNSCNNSTGGHRDHLQQFVGVRSTGREKKKKLHTNARCEKGPLSISKKGAGEAHVEEEQTQMWGQKLKLLLSTNQLPKITEKTPQQQACRKAKLAEMCSPPGQRSRVEVICSEQTVRRWES